ncbi:MAG: sensor histidine kinase N-terminal domain-containing protein [Thioclava marina]|jgi:Signal transduction histidine kinase|uniref:ATP-binding protein n=1 Tax=Thioclava marina TaxID=1915077 RepID=UPI0019855AD4|nr:ATP-binding protein [Thioclava marina]MBC7146992.1 sensor histidine kinase N-terminal domain-containing protein [Thioclava marina]
MRAPQSLQLRLGLAVGLVVTVLWVAGAIATAQLARSELDGVFDSALEETAQRVLPLAVSEILGRENATGPQTVPAIRSHDEHFTYLVRDGAGAVLLQSHRADPAAFPPYAGPGFSQTAALRLYSDEALRGSMTITVAEPLAHRATVARELQIGLLAPLALIVPLSLAAIALILRFGFAPLRRFRLRLAQRGAADLSAVEVGDLPAEVLPLAQTMNALLARLDAAFQAERSFAANAAHELRTPLAGAIAQAQRLRAETKDPAAAARAGEIEAGLKRLTRLSEGLMQLARAEGGKLRTDTLRDLRPVARIMVEDTARLAGAAPVALDLPPAPVLSDLDPDLFGILCRNLVDNALRHGTPGTPVSVRLDAGGRLTVENDCAALPAETLARLGTRFERAAGAGKGSGLGLAIVHAIVARAGGRLALASPFAGQARGFAVTVDLPLAHEA